MAAAAAHTASRARLAGGGVLAALERWLGLTSTGLGLLGLIAVGFLTARATGSRAMFLLVYGAVLMLVAAWLLGRRRLAIDAHRSDLPTRVREGQLVDVEVALTARRRLATIVVEDTLPEPLGASSRLPVALLPPGQELRHRYTFTPRLRGIYEVGPLLVEWSDPFGLTRRRTVLAAPAKVIVHPSTEQVHDRVISRAWEDPPIRPPVSKPWPTGFEFYGMRDYVHGDDPRRIVWRASARTIDPETGAGRYLVREAEQGITDQVHLFLDTDRATHAPGQPSETFETMIRAVASVGVHHLKDGFAVHSDINSERLTRGLRGPRSQLTLLDGLAGVQPEAVPLTRALERLFVEPSRGIHNVVFTPHLDHEAAGRLRLLLQRGTSILLVLLLWEESDGGSMHRAGSLGCGVVELRSNQPFERVFQRVVGARR